jgi:hypothetical protein
MGMDYVPRRKGIDGYHINWAGHELFGRCLDLLGANLATWSGCNDGVIVPAATCSEWAGLIRTALGDGRIRFATVRGIGGRDHDIPVIGGAATRERGSLSWEYEFVDVAYGGAPFTAATPTFPIDPKRRRLLDSFADFLAACGGCYQR